MNEIKILREKISEKHNDSFWYDNEDIAISKTKKGTELLLVSCGEIKIRDKDGYIVYSGGKERNEGIEFGLENDDNLKQIFESDKYEFEYNNWFEVLFKFKDTDTWDCELGNVATTYDEAIELLKSYLEDESWEEQ